MKAAAKLMCIWWILSLYSLGNCALEMTGYVYLTDQLNEVKEEFEEKAFQSHCSTFAPFLVLEMQ